MLVNHVGIVSEILPIKQGLKLEEYLPVRIASCSLRDTSNKTRIETPNPL